MPSRARQHMKENERALITMTEWASHQQKRKTKNVDAIMLTEMKIVWIAKDRERKTGEEKAAYRVTRNLELPGTKTMMTWILRRLRSPLRASMGKSVL